VNNVRHENSRHFRKNREHMRDKSNELEENNKGESIIHMCRGVNKLKRGLPNLLGKGREKLHSCGFPQCFERRGS
jgi:hypothetical protein